MRTWTLPLCLSLLCAVPQPAWACMNAMKEDRGMSLPKVLGLVALLALGIAVVVFLVVRIRGNSGSNLS